MDKSRPVKMEYTEFDHKVLSMKDSMYRLAKSMLGDRQEAEDAVHDILEKLWRQRGSLDRYDNVEAFIYISVRNHCVDRIRSRNTRLRKAESIGYESGGTAEIARGIEMRDIRNAVESLIGSLPEKQRLVIHLRDVEECEFSEIAQITGMDETNVRVTLSRARKTVREKMLKIMNHGI